MVEDAVRMRLNYFTEVSGQEFFDSFDLYMRENRTSRAFRGKDCYLVLSINENITYAKVTGGQSVRIYPDESICRFVSNTEFLAFVALCVGCNIMSHE